MLIIIRGFSYIAIVSTYLQSFLQEQWLHSYRRKNKGSILRPSAAKN